MPSISLFWLHSFDKTVYYDVLVVSSYYTELIFVLQLILNMKYVGSNKCTSNGFKVFSVSNLVGKKLHSSRNKQNMLLKVNEA